MFVIERLKKLIKPPRYPVSVLPEAIPIEIRKTDYLSSLEKVDLENIQQFLEFASRLDTKIAVLAVGSSTQRHVVQIHDLDMRILCTPLPNTEERRVVVENLRVAIREFLKTKSVTFKEDDATTEPRMVPGIVGDKHQLVSFVDYYNNDPSFEVEPINGLPLHIFISGVDRFNLSRHLGKEKANNTRAIVLLNTSLK